MTFITIALLAVNIGCYVVQTFFNKLYALNYQGPRGADSAAFSLVYGVVTMVATFLYNGCQMNASTSTILMGIGNGLVLFVYNLGSIRAAQSGPYAFQSVITLFGNILLPLLFSALWWGERLSAVKLIGIGVMLCAFILFNLKGLSLMGAKKGYLGWLAVLFVANGVYGITMDAQQRVNMQTQRNEMIIIIFAVVALVSAVYLLVTRRGQALGAFRMGRKGWIYAVGSSVAAALAVNLMMFMLSLVPASVLYTVENGGVLIFSALLSAAVLHERIEKHMVAGIAAAAVSLVLLGI